ncbi:FAD-dependent oxidoreductase [Bailinhaonella thermotolerans]|uniref:FAD-dependent oxidoreductase n=2 Tax=Bailinhaonella thermotolerans TaxID=1070861 RepID=A0A3A4B154_9ACTN|nr:FAD-dependent oxidoreductase [Bailinhaonella thermotolerans]
MDRPITRRDFFDGVALAVGATALGAAAGCADEPDRSGMIGTPRLEVPAHRAYPPDLQGLRGNTDPALSVPHALRDDRFWGRAGRAHPTGEHYDLVVVGAGISGTAAAYLWARRHPKARVLILDNHDDFGGHARRNEFHPKERSGPLIGYGGSQSIEAPKAWTAEGKALLADLGVDLKKFGRFFDQKLYGSLGMNESVFCDRETFGRDHLAIQDGRKTPEFVRDMPIAEQAKKDMVMLSDHPRDWFPGLSDEDKKNKLATMTYAQFLKDVCKVHPDVVKFYHTQSSDEWAYATDAMGAHDAWASGYPGFDGMKLDDSKPFRLCSPSIIKEWDDESAYIDHFPDGNHSLVRLMLRSLIPGLAPGGTMEDVVTARFDYGRLDQPGSRVRVRLSSPVVRVAHRGDPARSRTVEVAYFDGRRVRSVTAGNVVMACWNMMIPYLCPDVPPDQAKALHEAVKMPLVYAMVQLRDWRAWVRRKVHQTRFTGAYWCVAELDFPVSMGSYRCPRSPDEPINVHMIRIPTKPGMSPRNGAVAGRYELLRTSFSYFEYSIRDQLNRLLGPGGFDAARDIEAITVNRWGHGYAPEYTRPWDPWYPDGPLPADTARRRVGRIAIANSDSVPAAYADAAITAATRAVGELQSS